MKNIILSSILMTASVVSAQKKLGDISLPTSPAASILSIQPSATITPKSFKALEAALYSNFSNDAGGALIPNDFGLEFMPYWFNDHGLTITEYLQPKNIGSQLIRNSSFSLASTQNFLLADSTATNSISWGYRTSLFFSTKTHTAATLTQINNLSERAAVTAAVNAYLFGYSGNAGIDTAQEYLLALKPDLQSFLTKSTAIVLSPVEYDILFYEISEEALQVALTPDSPSNFIEEVNNIISKHFSKKGLFISNFDDLKKKLLEREGFGIDFAYAMLLNFPTNNFEFSVVPRQSVWLAPSYIFNSSGNTTNFKGTGILRYEWYNDDYFDNYFPTVESYKNNIDYGLALSMAYNNLSIQLEGTGRSSYSLEEAGVDSDGDTLYKKNNASDFQYIATISYRLTDQIALSYQFGSAFEPVFSPNKGTLISLLSLNFGFGGPSTANVN